MLYNATLGIIFGFGPAMLVEHGGSASAARSTTIVALWFVAISVPLGGLIADQLGRRDPVPASGFATFAVFMRLAAQMSHILPMFFVLDLVGGLAVNPIMSLLGDVLSRP